MLSKIITITIGILFSCNLYLSSQDTDLLFVCREPVEAKYDPDEFIFPDWEEGSLVDYKNKTHKISGRYHVGNDEMQILLRDSPKVILPQKIKTIKIGKMIFAPSEFEAEGVLTYGYFRILSEGRISLLSKFNNEEGKLRKEYFYCEEDTPAYYLKRTRKNVVNILGNNRTESYLKENKLDVKIEKDLISIFNFSNSLYKY